MLQGCQPSGIVLPQSYRQVERARALTCPRTGPQPEGAEPGMSST